MLDENGTKHVNRAVWQTAEFVTLQQMVLIVTTWLKSLILVVEAIFIEYFCSVMRFSAYNKVLTEDICTFYVLRILIGDCWTSKVGH